MSIGAIIGKEFTEGGVSSTTTRRPALQAMLTYLEEEARAGRPVDYVIVHKLDRLVRNRYDDTTLGKRFDELGVRLVSTSENIDQTPGGLLVHGIMASIAEFYSKNLSNEVKKGMAEKVRGGGCIGRAPLGYRNVITTKNGQEARIVVVDEVRGPLVTWAFKAYASGEWTLRRLAEELTLRGLTTVPIASLPEKPVTVQLLSKVLHNPFYVGEVVYQGVHYAGSHEPLVDRATYESVQTLLTTRVNGERTVKHAHYLKSTIYCGICGSRLIVTNVKPRGVVYEYFVCLGRHSKKQPQCLFRATLAEQIEDEIVRLYDRVALRPGQRAVLEPALQRQLSMLVAESTQRLTEAKTVRRRLERERDKLLQAHYADAIPLEVLKREQSRISRELRGVERQMTGLEGEMTERQALVGQALDIAQHMATAYRQAPEHIRRMLNQVLFDKVYITPDDETGLLTAIVRYQPPFDGVLGVRDVTTAGDGLQRAGGNAAGAVEEMDDDLDAMDGGTGESKTMASDTPTSPRDDEVTSSQPSDIVVSASEGPGLHGLPDDGLPAPKPSKNKQKPTSWDFHDVGLSVDSMVGVTGFEPATSPSRTVRATKLRHTPTPSLVYPTSEYNKSMSLERYLATATLLSEQITLRELAIILRELVRVQTVPGAVVEFGCYAGTTSIHIARWLGGKQFHVYDSFVGLPEKTTPDISPVGEQFRPGELLATKKQFMTNLKKAGVPLPHIHKGWFRDLHPSDVPASISFAFLDGDYYESILTPLRLIEDKLADGAVIVVDDYANEALPGAARAVDEWLRTHPARLRVEQSLAVIHPQSTATD